VLNVTQEGAVFLVNVWTNVLPWRSWKIHLFGAGIIPAHTDTLALYAARELVAPGYAPIDLMGGSPPWTNGPYTYGATFQHDPVTWTFTGAATVYGYYLADQFGTWSIWSEIFGTPYVYGAAGGGFGIQLIPNLISCFFPEPLCP